jgi:hypothetical protein
MRTSSASASPSLSTRFVSTATSSLLAATSAPRPRRRTPSRSMRRCDAWRQSGASSRQRPLDAAIGANLKSLGYTISE